MVLELEYKGYRIVAIAVAEGDLWNCDVMLRRTSSQDIPYRELVTCFKVTATFVEPAGARSARAWIDLHQ